MGTPLLFIQHFRGNLDNYDPADTVPLADISSITTSLFERQRRFSTRNEGSWLGSSRSRGDARHQLAKSRQE